MKPILMRMGCVGMLLLAAGIVDGAGSRPYSSQAFWPLLLLAMGIAVGGMGLGVLSRMEKDNYYLFPHLGIILNLIALAMVSLILYAGI